MSRKRTGLRNKYRSGGQSSYSAQKKNRVADIYGTYQGGRCLRPDSIAGRTVHATRSQGAS